MSRPSFTKLIWRQSEKASANCRRPLKLFGNNRKKDSFRLVEVFLYTQKTRQEQKTEIHIFLRAFNFALGDGRNLYGDARARQVEKVEINGDGGDAEVTLITDRR